MMTFSIYIILGMNALFLNRERFYNALTSFVSTVQITYTQVCSSTKTL